MTTMTATKLSRNLSRVLDRLENDSEEVEVVRNRHVVGRLVPGPMHMTALEALADVYRAKAVKDDDWMEDSHSSDLKNTMEDPWE